MAKNSIRIKDSVKRIEVNDKGDYIVLRRDVGFYKKVMSLYEEIQSFVKKGQKIIDEHEAGKLPESAYEDEIYALYKKMHDKIDDTFGKNTCLKVFGFGEEDVLPELYDVADFMEQILPYVEDLVNKGVSKGKRYESFVEKEMTDVQEPTRNFTVVQPTVDNTQDNNQNEVKEVEKEGDKDKKEEAVKDEQVLLSKSEYDRLLSLLDKYEV